MRILTIICDILDYIRQSPNMPMVLRRRALTSTKDIQQLIDDGKTDIALEHINDRLGNNPTPDLHLLRLQAMRALALEDIPAIRDSLDWLQANNPASVTAACEQLETSMQERLTAIPGLDDDEDRDELPKNILETVQALEPLADYLPIIHLAHGLVLTHLAQTRSNRRRSPLDILEEMLANSSRESAGGDGAKAAGPQAELYQRARHHLQLAAQHFPMDDPRRGEALETMGQVCEALDDPSCAWRAYHEAQRYDRDFREKLETLSTAVHQQARQRALDHIDRLLQAGDLNGADVLLAACMPADEAQAADFLVRKADLLFLRGAIDDAMALYARLLENNQ